MDRIPLEVWKFLGEEVTNMLWDLMQMNYEQEQCHWRGEVV